MAFDISSILPFIGGAIDTFGNNSRYNDQASMTREQLAFQKWLFEQSAGWQDQNNLDLYDYITSQNPLSEQEAIDLNTGNADWADYINNTRTDFSGEINDMLTNRLEGADNLAGKDYAVRDQIGGDILDIALGRDSSIYSKEAEGLASQIGDNPYDRERWMADAEDAATMAVDRQYGGLMDRVSRDAARLGTDASGQLLDLGSQAARDAVEATLKARLEAPQAYETTNATRQGRLGSSINALEGVAGGIDTRAMGGAKSAADVYSGGIDRGIELLTRRPEYEDPSKGLVNPLQNYQSVIARRTNPYSAQTNPYSGLKPTVTNPPSVTSGKTNYDVLGLSLADLLSGR